MKSILTIFLIISLSSSLFSQTRPMTTDDGLDLVRLRGAKLSPDGQSIIYGSSKLNWEKNKYDTKYHYISSDGSNGYQYIGEAGASDLQFSPDGKYLALKRKAKEYQQIFLMRTTGGEAVQLTKHNTSVGNYQWTSDSKRIIFKSNIAQTKEQKKEEKDGYDAVFIDEGPNGQQKGSWSHLWACEVADGNITQLTKEEWRIGGFDVSPDGQQIIFTARKENRRNQGNLSEIYLLNVSDSSQTALTNNKAPEGGLKWAPDGKKFAYTAPDANNWELKNNKIFVMDVATKTSEIVSEQFVGSIRTWFWMKDSKSILFSGLQKTSSNLFKLDVASKTFTKLTNQTGSLSLIDFNRETAQIIYSFGDHKTPSDLYFADLSPFQSTRLTNLNKEKLTELQLSNMEVVTWKSKDGLEIEGLVFYPIGYKEGKSYPLLLHIHGGPAGVFTDGFRSQYHVWAGLGYVQLCPNVRGSSGYSDELLRGNMKDIGGMDYEDLMSGVDQLIKEGIADSEKMAVRGWSYGGILGGTTITKTSRFKAASLGAMVSDWTSEYGIGFNYDVRLWYIGGTPWENPEGYRNQSPLTHVSNVTTPTLILHGSNDRTDTEAQSMMFFNALKDLGKTTRYIRFPREPHGFREPRHQRTRDIEEIAWIQKYTLGLDWKAWDRKDDKKAEDKKMEIER